MPATSGRLRRSARAERCRAGVDGGEPFRRGVDRAPGAPQDHRFASLLIRLACPDNRLTKLKEAFRRVPCLCCSAPIPTTDHWSSGSRRTMGCPLQAGGFWLRTCHHT
jgi:hypothetical protein